MWQTRLLRYVLLTTASGLVVWLALGYGSRSFEAWCPFGGMESLWGLVTEGEFSCALGPLNLSLLLGIVALALIAKKAFCGWACPVGFLGELFGRLGALFVRGRFTPPGRVDGWMRVLRYAVLGVSLYFTYRLGELILRGYDPFYLVFSGMGHGTVGPISWIVLAVLALGGLAIPMFFCRYLCPLSAVLDPFARLGVIKVTRNTAGCTDCGHCQTACPHSIPVQAMTRVRHRDCTNCLECVDACPEENVLSLRANF